MSLELYQILSQISSLTDRVSRFNTGLLLDRGLSVAGYTRARKMLECIDGRLSIFRRQ
ncbi:hypothetical protein QUA20_28825 [Microcoleus sp. Pol7_A1]|uniref:hypothetical protein n=1 Tax=Microcoleus sp. Pol7_A1 TaxID=2818893 RepID=UPI002FD1E5C0